MVSSRTERDSSHRYPYNYHTVFPSQMARCFMKSLAKDVHDRPVTHGLQGVVNRGIIQ